MSFAFSNLKGYVYKPRAEVFDGLLDCWVGHCPRCDRLFLGATQPLAFGLVDHHMRTESHFVCVGCRELQSECGCA